MAYPFPNPLLEMQVNLAFLCIYYYLLHLWKICLQWLCFNFYLLLLPFLVCLLYLYCVYSLLYLVSVSTGFLFLFCDLISLKNKRWPLDLFNNWTIRVTIIYYNFSISFIPWSSALFFYLTYLFLIPLYW